MTDSSTVCAVTAKPAPSNFLCGPTRGLHYRNTEKPQELLNPDSGLLNTLSTTQQWGNWTLELSRKWSHTGYWWWAQRCVGGVKFLRYMTTGAKNLELVAFTSGKGDFFFPHRRSKYTPRVKDFLRKNVSWISDLLPRAVLFERQKKRTNEIINGWNVLYSLMTLSFYLKFVKHVPIYKSIIRIFVDLLRMSKNR